VEYSRDIQGHVFRRIGEIREGAEGNGAGHDTATAREVNHTLLSGNRSLNVKAADAWESDCLGKTTWRGAITCT